MILKNRDDIGYFLNYYYLTGCGAEIGVQKGIFSEKILSTWKGEMLFSIDIWENYQNYTDIANVSQEQQEKLFLEASARLSSYKNSFIIRQYSLEASSLFENNSLDFVYIDANHKYEFVSEDIISWYPKIRPGGLISGHDYLNGYIEGSGEFGVKKAVDEFVAREKLRLFHTEEYWPTWYAFKA
jgi:hypothetical protein